MNADTDWTVLTNDEYAVAALLVALAVWKLATNKGSTRSFGDSRCCGSVALKL